MVAQLDDAYAAVGASRAVRLASWALFEGRPLTTRGRWWNPCVLGLHHLHRALPRLADVEQPVFIMGMGRSGTTLLGRILSVHRKVGFLNEPKALWHVAVANEDVIGSYSRAAARYRLSASDADTRTTRDLQRLMGAYLFWMRRERLVDKNPEVVYRIPFVRAVFPQARFLLVVRDGWQVCRSVERWCDAHGVDKRGEWHDWWGAGRRKWNLLLDQIAVDEPDLSPQIETMRRWQDQRQMAAIEWILAMRYGLRQLEAAPDAVSMVRYEDLVSAPAETMLETLRFCSLSEDPAVVRYATQVAHAATPGQPFDLPPAVEAAFVDVLERLGYQTP